jgi:hypothetical protein
MIFVSFLWAMTLAVGYICAIHFYWWSQIITVICSIAWLNRSGAEGLKIILIEFPFALCLWVGMIVGDLVWMSVHQDRLYLLSIILKELFLP